MSLKTLQGNYFTRSRSVFCFCTNLVAFDCCQIISSIPTCWENKHQGLLFFGNKPDKLFGNQHHCPASGNQTGAAQHVNDQDYEGKRKNRNCPCHVCTPKPETQFPARFFLLYFTQAAGTAKRLSVPAKCHQNQCDYASPVTNRTSWPWPRSGRRTRKWADSFSRGEFFQNSHKFVR